MELGANRLTSRKEEPSVWSRIKEMTHEVVLLLSSLTKRYAEVQI